MSDTFTIATYNEWYRQLIEGRVTAAEIKPAWEKFQRSKDGIMAELRALKKAELVRFVTARWADDKKETLVAGAWNSMQRRFQVGNLEQMITFEGVGSESLEAALGRQLDKWTDELIQKRAKDRAAAIDARKKALTAPETLEEFDQYVRYHGIRAITPEEMPVAKKMKEPHLSDFIQSKGEAKLTPEQLIKYDELRAAAGREVRRRQAEAKATVDAVETPAGVQLSEIIATKHTQKGHDLFVIQLSSRVERSVYDTFLARAKQLGGSYSSYARDGAVPGFQFRDRAAAEQFASLARIDGAQRVEERTEARQANAAERLAVNGEARIERAEETIAEDRKVNTARRAEKVAQIHQEARAEAEKGQTQVALSAAMARGELIYLDRISNGAQVDMFNRILRSAQYDRVLDAQKAGKLSYSQTEEALGMPPGEDDIVAVKYPYLRVPRAWIDGLIQAGASTPGAVRLSRNVSSFLRHGAAQTDVVHIGAGREYLLQKLKELADAVAGAPAGRGGKYSAQMIQGAMADYLRMKAMNIFNEVDLRVAMREFVRFKADRLEEDPIAKAERGLIGRPLAGFFPTPPSLVEEMVEKAEIEPGMVILEPEAGKGDVAVAIKAAAPDVKLDVLEINQTLEPILTAKGLAPKMTDFLCYTPGPIYDRILMNPPFENGQDIEHVRHAYDLLKPGGRLVAIMSAGAFFQGNRKAEEFRSWLGNAGGRSEKNPDGAFAGADAFRATGVSTRMVVIEKQAERIAVAQDPAQAVLCFQTEAPAGVRMAC